MKSFCIIWWQLQMEHVFTVTVRVCICLCVFVCVYVCMSLCVWEFVWVCLSVCLSLYVQTQDAFRDIGFSSHVRLEEAVLDFINWQSFYFIPYAQLLSVFLIMPHVRDGADCCTARGGD